MTVPHGKQNVPMEDIDRPQFGNAQKSLQTSLKVLVDQGVIAVEKGTVAIKDRLRLCEILIREGCSPESVSRFLDWEEFERFCRRALEENGFSVISNLRFVASGRRYEIDLLALRSPFLLFLDAKHWRPGRSSSYKEAVRSQRARMNAAVQSESVRKSIRQVAFNEMNKLPLIVSLADTCTHVIDGTPIVPIFRFNSFLLRLEEIWDDLTSRSMEESAA